MIKGIIDTGPIVAFFDESDNYCLPCRSFLKNFKGKLFTSLAVVTEVSYLLSDNKRIQRAFIEWIDNNAISILNLDDKQFLPMGRSVSRSLGRLEEPSVLPEYNLSLRLPLVSSSRSL